MRKVTIIFFDAGGGHRNAAEALQGVLESQSRPWDVKLLNLQELLDAIDVVRRATGIRIQDGYNLILRKGWTRPTPQLLVLLRSLVSLYHPRVLRVLEDYWAGNPTDLVLSVIPLFNRAIAESVRQSLPGTPFVTLLTDFADTPPHFWMEPESEYLICGTERARQQALAMGHPKWRVFETSGMVMKPKFYKKPVLDRAAERKRLGLDPALPTGIVLFGGHGAPAMLDIARSLSQGNHPPLQLLMMCGHNRKLQAELKGLTSDIPMFVEGFTPHMEHYMSLADFFIGKPGPGSISEALQFHLPVIVERNARTMPQERYNADWLQEKRLGIVLSSFREIAAGVEELLAPTNFEEIRRHARAYSNQAVFEIPLILDEVYQSHVPHSVPVSSPWTGMDPFGQGAAWAGLT
ncbi:MAG: galactosyldiacylglycerol synthase [Acidobacteria bacterium]|nr:galactosyldiacylglycerol synthase [Acidobacteriota bacterium]